MAKKSSLGKGLGKLLEQHQTEKTDVAPTDVFFSGDSASHKNNKKQKIEAEYLEIKTTDIEKNPNQPRKDFSKTELKELSASIKEVGLLQPIVVRKTTGKKSYQIVMGERRYRASVEAGLTKIPAIIKETKNEDMLRDAILENIHRVELNPIEEAASYKQMIDDFGSTHLELSKKLSKSRAYITNSLRLLNLPTETQKLLLSGELTQGHAKALLQLSDKENINYLSNKVVENGLSVRVTEKLAGLKNISEIDSYLKNASSGKTNKLNSKKILLGHKSKELISLENELSEKLNTVVKVNLGIKKGTIKIDFATMDDLNRIIKLF